MSDNLKFRVQDFWNARSCGEVYASGKDDREFYDSHARWRYQLEPYIKDFADFDSGRDKDILEIGVGMGADHVEWGKSRPRSLSGIDLSDRAVEHTARRLAVDGFAVAVGFRTGAKEAADVVTEITDGGGVAIAVQADVSIPDSCAAAIAQVKERLGRIDVLVNNAGIFIQRRFADIDPAFFDQMFHTNVLGPLTLMQSCFPHLGEGGRIINVLSTLAIEPLPTQSVYAATKAALRALTQAHAKDFGRIGATINAVAPGVILTDMMKNAPPEALARVASETAAGRVGQPEDIAPIIAFLASPQSAWLNGRMLAADGGRTVY